MTTLPKFAVQYMMRRKGILVAIVTRLMLLYFTLAVIPIDFFHTHHIASSLSSVNKNFTHHREDRSASLSSYCLICNAHFDRTYAYSFISFGQVYLPIKPIRFAEKIIFAAQKTIGAISLRGPPLMA
ncbi:hypothetical protein [Olivibacter ginsenosidimutans]|uniref:hypothetical protein n=1 Tax=Olivibacter ginsenosidimutans TaxID=1176537 RepID=UPI0031EF062A